MSVATMADAKPDRLLVLDLDECLIFGAESPLARPADFRVGPFFIYRRPHLADFLKTTSTWFKLAVWSSATSDYASEIALSIRPANVDWSFVWGRERCTLRRNPETGETQYLKDLKKLKRQGFHLEHVLFIDDTPAKLARNFGNAVYVSPYIGSMDDDELKLLRHYLDAIRTVPDFRTLEKRAWRSHMQLAKRCGDP